MLKRWSWLVLAFLPSFLSAQHFEVGVMGGISNYTGELAPAPLMPKSIHFAAGAFGRYNFSNFFAVKGHFYGGRISGKDANSKREDRQLRNLSFRSNLFELGATAEFNLLGYQPYALEKVFSPYIFAGLAGFYFNPEAKYQSDWYKLRPLRTEGQGMSQFPQRKQYSLLQMSIPFGIGFKMAISDKWNIGLEAGVRKVFTDYLDDVSLSYVSREDLLVRDAGNPLAANLANRSGEVTSDGQPIAWNESIQRGDDRDFDWYSFIGLTVSYNFIDNGLVGARNRRGNNRKGCKSAKF